MQSKQVSGDRPRRGSSANRGGLCYDGFRCGLGLLLSLFSPNALVPNRPCCFFPFSSRTQTKPHFQRLIS